MCKKYMCKNYIVVYFIEEFKKPIKEDIFKKYFPNIKVITYILNDEVKNNLTNIMKTLENKYCVIKYILSIYSSSIQKYFIPLIYKYYKSIFVATYSTIDNLRVNPIKNLFFSLENDSNFIEKWIIQGQLVTNSIFISDNNPDIYNQNIINLVKSSGGHVILLEDMNSVENQELISTARLIGLSSYSFENQLKICENLPRDCYALVTFLDSLPTTNEELDSLSSVLPKTLINLLATVHSTLLTLDDENQWVNDIKLQKSKYTDTANVSIYSLLNSINCYKKLLINSNLIKNNNYYVYGLVSYGQIINLRLIT